MRILITTLCYPTPVHPDQGIFVQRRTAALAAVPEIDLRVIAPQLYCPLLRRTTSIPDCTDPLSATYPKMLSIPVLGRATDGLAYARTLERCIRADANQPDLIDAHFEYPDGVGAWLAGRRLGIPVVVTIRGKIVSLSKRTVRRLQIGAMLRGVQARIAVSESLANWVRRIGGSTLSVDVIPNGIDATLYHLIPRDQARTALGWNRDAKYVLAVGHQQYVKGFDRLLNIVSALRASQHDVRFILVGSQRGERRFQRNLRRQGIRCNAESRFPVVTFIDPVPADRLNLMYNAADVLVCPSRSEGWCNAIAESLAAGRPVVATDVGGNREQICSSELGILVSDGDETEMTRAVTTALSQDWNRMLISAHGAARTWTHVAKEVHAVFQRVVASCHCSVSSATGNSDPAMPQLIASPFAREIMSPLVPRPPSLAPLPEPTP